MGRNIASKYENSYVAHVQYVYVIAIVPIQNTKNSISELDNTVEESLKEETYKGNQEVRNWKEYA